MTRTTDWSNGGSWFLVGAYCAWETIALLLSTLYSFAQPVIQETYDVSDVQVVTLGQSMQIIGNMFGVALMSPVSYEGSPPRYSKERKKKHGGFWRVERGASWLTGALWAWP